MRNKPRQIFEYLLLATGVTLLVVFAATLLYRSILSRVALAHFDRAQAALIQKGAEAGAEAQAGEVIEVHRSPENRIRDFRMSLPLRIDPPVAILRLDRLRVRVPVFEGTGDAVLNRGAGWIAGTARPGASNNSNIGIAAHRDGFFRGLKDVLVGDAIELLTPGLVSSYAVDGVEIVDPYNVGVLRPGSEPSLTLVTCYPFYFIGDAPKRFIVHASLKRQVGVRKLEDRISAFAGTTPNRQ